MDQDEVNSKSMSIKQLLTTALVSWKRYFTLDTQV
jgi:hypothetical protein